MDNRLQYLSLVAIPETLGTSEEVQALHRKLWDLQGVCIRDASDRNMREFEQLRDELVEADRRARGW